MSIRKSFKVFLSGLIIFVLNFTVNAQNEVKKLQEISKKMYADLGGVIIVSQTSISFQGFEMISDSKIFKKQNKTRTENSIAGFPGRPGPMEMTTIADGNDFWMISPERGKEKVDKNNPMAQMGKSAFDSGIPDSAKFLRTEKVGDRDCYVFQFTVTTPMGSANSTIWFDKKTAVLVKNETETPQGKVSTKVEAFKKLKDKWEMPMKITATMDGSPMMIANITSIQTDQNLSDDLFNADKAEVK